MLFDLDNTLHDRDAGVRAFLTAQHAGHELSCHGVSLERWTERFVSMEERGRVWKDVIYAQLVEEFGLPYSPESLLATYVEGFAKHVVPHQGLLETLAALRVAGWRTGVVTNGRSAFQRRTIAALGVEPLVDAVVVSEEVNLRKPDPRIFEMALRELGCGAEDSSFVGDDPIADVQGARGAGMRAVHFGRGGLISLGDVPRIVGRPDGARGE